MSAERTLEFVDLSKAYPSPAGTVTVVEGFALNVAQGECVALIGHSGCGKSTVLSMAAGLIEPTSGSVVLGGHEVDGPGPDRAVVFQSPSLFPWMTALENVLLGVRRVFPHGTPAQREDICRYFLDKVGLGGALHKKAAELSQGMRQRVGIARAFALKPKLLLLDEPFGMLDSLTRAGLQQVLLEVWASHRITALMVTHDVDEALLLADRVVMMTNGPHAHVGEILTVPFDRPRTRAGVMEHPEYYALRESLIRFLEDRGRHARPAAASKPRAARARPRPWYRQWVGASSSLAFALALIAHGVFAAPPPDSPFGAAPASRYGQIRTRTEFDQKTVADTAADPFLHTQLRTRLGFIAHPSERVEVKVELQDARIFGSAPPPAATAGNPATASVGNAKGVDLLQGYAKLRLGDFQAALGRQKMSLGTGRFLSSLEWHPYARAFDGLSGNFAMEPGNLTALAYVVRDTAATAVKDRLLLGGLFYHHRFGLNAQADAYIFYDQSRLPSAGAANYDLVYAGQRLAGKLGPFSCEEEFIWQGGELNLGGAEKTSAAYQLGLRLGAALGPHKVNLGLDLMSGDDNPADATVKAYRANYSFAHAYFGWMDYFLANPPFGVADWRADADLGFFPNPAGIPRLSLKAQYHFFLPQSAPSGAESAYGQEIDMELHAGFIPKSNIVLGAGTFLPGANAFRLPAARLTPGQESRPGWFLYLMPVFNF